MWSYLQTNIALDLYVTCAPTFWHVNILKSFSFDVFRGTSVTKGPHYLFYNNWPLATIEIAPIGSITILPNKVANLVK